MDWLSHSNSPWRFVAMPKRWLKSRPDRTQPERIRMALEELGTTYIKLGQAISTRTDILPPEYVEELSKLQDSAPSIPYSDVRAVIIEEFGDPPETLFREFVREPEAAASIAQVHRAMLHDGNWVVVKVQRPGVREKVEQDLLVLRDVATFLTSSTTLGQQYDFSGWLDEFAYTIRNELDFRREGRNADRIRENFMDDPDLRIPQIHWCLTSRRVLTMEEVTGVKLNDFAALDAYGIDRRRLAQVCARIVLTEVFKHGFFHADPHPGNFFVLPSGAIGLIDLGMVGHLDEPTRQSLMRVTLDLAREDADALVDELLVLGSPRGPMHRQELRLDLSRLIQTRIEGPPEDFSLAHLLNEVLAIAARRRIHVPSDLLFLAKTIAMCEGLSSTLDPDFDLVSFTKRFLEEYAVELREPKLIAERLKDATLDLGDLALALPKKARRLFGQLERGEIVITGRLENTNQILDHVHIAANRMAMAILMAGLIVGMSFVVSRLESRGLTTTLLQLMLGLSVIAGIALLVSIWRSTKR